MKRFRKKQIVIEAVQITDGTFDAPYPNLDHISGVVYDPIVRCAYIQAREGIMQADLGDWIIKGVRGELYPCKPDIFDETYEPEFSTITTLEALFADDVTDSGHGR